MAKPFFDLERLDPDSLRRVATILRDLGYTEEGIRDRLGLADVSQISLASYPYFLDYRLRRRTPLDLAIIVFMLQGVGTEEELGELEQLEELEREEMLLLERDDPELAKRLAEMEARLKEMDRKLEEMERAKR